MLDDGWICEYCRSKHGDNDEPCYAYPVTDDYDCDIFDYLQAIAQAQEQATLREVGEIIDKWRESCEQTQLWMSEWARLTTIIEALKSGRMPE